MKRKAVYNKERKKEYKVYKIRKGKDVGGGNFFDAFRKGGIYTCQWRCDITLFPSTEWPILQLILVYECVC